MYLIKRFLSGSGRYFDEISQDTGKYCFGVEDTLRALELGSVETLICWENLDIQRYVLKNHTNAEEKVLHLTPEQEKDKTHFTDKEVSVGILSGKSEISSSPSCCLKRETLHLLVSLSVERGRVRARGVSTAARVARKQL